MNSIKAGDPIEIVKGCRARGINKGTTLYIRSIEPLGGDYSHCVKVVLNVRVGSIVFYARFQHYLENELINLNDGNPLHKIQIKRA